MIIPLQSLRFIFALFIFAEHFPISADQPHILHGAGAMGVSFFLVLSGFVMSVGYEDKVRMESFKITDFIIKRLIKLWPSHALCLIVWIALAYGAWGSSAIHPLPLVGNLFLLQWLPIDGIGGNTVAWCLSVLVCLYILYPLLGRSSTRSLIVLLLTLMCCLQIGDNYISANLSNWYWYTSPISRLSDFLIGILAFRCYQSIEQQGIGHRLRQQPIWTMNILLLIPLLVYAFSLITLKQDFTPMKSVYLFYIPSFLTINLFTIYNNRGGVLYNKCLVYLGSISFSFYMVHNLVILFTKKVLEITAPGTHWILRLIITFVLTLAASIIVNRYFEPNTSRLLSKLLLKNREH